jgi:mycothiol synthase
MTHPDAMRTSLVALGVRDLRAFDPGADFGPLAELICDVNGHDDVDWYPTPYSLAADWAPSPTFEPARDARVIGEDGRLVAAVRVEWRERSGKVVHRIETWVHPEQRRRGLGRRLLYWAERHARDSVAAGRGGPDQLPHFLSGGFDERNDAARVFATGAGYQPIRYHFEMRRPLDEPIPDLPMPAGLEIRPVAPEDHRRIWDADVEAFRDHWEPAVRHETDYFQFYAHPDVDTSLWLVAWDGDEVAGSVVNGVYLEENARLGLDIGWLDHVSVRRAWRKRGLASALVVRSLRALRDRGLAVAALGVDAENPQGALALYERLGFRRHRTWVTYRKPL